MKIGVYVQETEIRGASISSTIHGGGKLNKGVTCFSTFLFIWTFNAAAGGAFRKPRINLRRSIKVKDHGRDQ